MSGGQQQRVSIARALVNQPAIVWGDEPTGSLDSENSAAIMELLRSLNREHGQTFVLVTHDPTVAAATDRIIRMRDGHIEDDGLGNGTAFAATSTAALHSRRCHSRRVGRLRPYRRDADAGRVRRAEP